MSDLITELDHLKFKPMIIQKRLKRLRKVVDEFLIYTKWQAVNVFLVNESVFVSWIKPKSPSKGDVGIYLDYTSRAFPVEDINKRIRSYKDKIVVEKAKREGEKE